MNYKDKNWLKEQYVDLRQSSIMIAKKCDVSKPTILYWLKKFEIERRNISEFLIFIPSKKTRRLMSEAHKGKRHSEETRWKMSKSHIGKKHLEETKRKISKSSKGKVFSEEARKNMSEAGKEKIFTEEHKKNLSKAHMGMQGKEHSSLSKKMMSESKKGDKNWNWQNGKSFEPYCPAFNKELKEKIRNRDNRTCVLCGKSEILNGQRLSVHHIDGDKMQGCNTKEWYLCALCKSCNSKVDTIKKEFLIVMNILNN